MKAESTIRRQIRKLRTIAEDPAIPDQVQGKAYEAYHALRWAITLVAWTPARLLQDEAEDEAEELVTEI